MSDRHGSTPYYPDPYENEDFMRKLIGPLDLCGCPDKCRFNPGPDDGYCHKPDDLGDTPDE
jgi:hypothetical protein